MKNFRPSFKLLFGGVSLIAIFAFGVFSCKESSDVVNQNNQPTTSNSFLKFEGKALSHTNANFKEVKAGEGYIAPFHLMTTKVTEEDLSYIFDKTRSGLQLENLLDVKKTPEFMIFYLKENALKNTTLSNVVGVSIWTSQEDGNTEHRLYRINEIHQFVLDARYNADCNTAPLKKDINYLAATLLKKESEVNWVGYSKIGSNMRKAASDSPILVQFSQAVVNNADFILGTDQVQMFCNTCGGGDEGYCDTFDGCQWTCPTCCITTNLNDISKKSRLAYTTDLSLARQIRDNLMSKYKKGKTYTAFYYKISQIATTFNVVNAQNATEHLTLAADLIEVAQKLQYGENNEVIIDKELQDKALSMIKSYRKISTNGEFQRILETIEKDILALSLKEKTK